MEPKKKNKTFVENTTVKGFSTKFDTRAKVSGIKDLARLKGTLEKRA